MTEPDHVPMTRSLMPTTPVGPIAAVSTTISAMRATLGVLVSWFWPVAVLVGLIVAASMTRSCAFVRASHDNTDLQQVLGERGETKSVTVDPTVPMRALQRGDLVAIAHPRDADEHTFGIVVGLPGDSVEVVRDGEQSRLQIDGEPIASELPHRIGAHPAIVVPQGHVWLLSDLHRTDSIAIGPVPAAALRGRAKE